MTLAIPGGRGLFSQLQLALKQPSGKGRIRIHQEAQDQLEDMWTLAQDLASRPTRIAEIVPDATPHALGAVDAAKPGMGGVWFPPDDSSGPDTIVHPAIAWRHPFPMDIQDKVVSFSNLGGTITNSDLELAGTLAHQDVLVQSQDCRERTVMSGCDNTPSVSWRTKGSTTTAGPASYLLREASLHQRKHRYKQQHFHLAGQLNILADVLSRRFDLTDSQILAFLDRVAPQPVPWQLHPVLPAMISRIQSALHRKRPSMLSLQTEPVPVTKSGPRHGSPSAMHMASPPHSLMNGAQMTRSASCESLGSNLGLASTVEVNSRSALTMYATRSFRSQRRSPTWVGMTPASIVLEPLTFVSKPCGKA